MSEASSAVEHPRCLGRGCCRLKRAYFGYDHYDIALSLFSQWQLPDLFRQVLAASLRRADTVEPLASELSAALSLATATAEVLFGSDKAAAMARLTGLANDLYPLGIDGIDPLVSEAARLVAETTSLLEVRVSPDVPYREMLDEARRAMAVASLTATMRLAEPE